MVLKCMSSAPGCSSDANINVMEKELGDGASVNLEQELFDLSNKKAG